MSMVTCSLGLGRDPAVCYEQILTFLNNGNPDILRHGNAAYHGTKLSMRKKQSDNRLKNRLADDEMRAVMVLKESLIQQEVDLTPLNAVDSFLVHGWDTYFH